jgi:2-keto-3-deoxy-L-rhamnonate aldolase RhmA
VPYVRANRYYRVGGAKEEPAYYDDQNRNHAIFFLLETPRGVEEMEEIIRMRGSTSSRIGIFDLSVANGNTRSS